MARSLRATSHKLFYPFNAVFSQLLEIEECFRSYIKMNKQIFLALFFSAAVFFASTSEAINVTPPPFFGRRSLVEEPENLEAPIPPNAVKSLQGRRSLVEEPENLEAPIPPNAVKSLQGRRSLVEEPENLEAPIPPNAVKSLQGRFDPRLHYLIITESRQDNHNGGDHNEEGKKTVQIEKRERAKMEEQTNPSNDTAEQSILKQETTFEEEETSPPQDTSADPLTQIADALSKLLVARSPREIDVSPYDGTFEAQSFFDNFDAQADRAELTYTDRLRKLPCYLQGKPLQYFRNLRLDRLFYIEARQRLIDLFPATTEASFARFLAIKLTPQMPLEYYYQTKTVMGMKLDLPADILIESLTDELPVAEQRLIATVQPNTIKEWFDIVSRIRGTQCATSAVYQRQVDKALHPTYHNPPPRYNNQRPSHVMYQVTPPPSPCKYCNAMHWHSQCEQRFPRDRTRPVYSARPRTTTVPKRGTHNRPKVQSPRHVPQVQAARQDDSTSPASSSTSCLHVADPTPIICSPTIVSPTISPTYDTEISIPSNAAPQLEHCPHELHRILYEFSQVFSTNKYNVPKLNIPPVKINTTTDKIIALRPYRVPLHDQQEIQTLIEQMLQYGIIAPSVSPYASPITLVTKRDKTKRLCIDYRKLNEIIAPDVHPLPLIETILDKLSKAKYYSSVDIASAYWQVEIEPNSRNLLAFVTLDSQYEFCRLPYGFKNSPQIYHRAINQVMQKYKLNFVTHYFDDFIIFSDTLEDHLQHLQQFLTVCQHENIKLNYNKCSFFKTNIDFLGYTVTAGTYAPQTRNLDTINAIKPPTNQKTLQLFLGAVNVYNKFIADYARLRAPLNKLLKKDVKWNWDPDCQQAFTTLKESLTSKPVLHLYQVGLPCRLYCDASTQGIAGILKQVHPDGQVHPVQYFSRALRAHERNYTFSELECLAIVESVDKFRIYLTGIKFTIYTDHQALQWLKTIKNPSGRLFRWSLRLSTYNYEIHYLKGSQQHEADLLSRNPFVGFISADIIKQHQPTASTFSIDTNGLHTITRKGVTKIIIPETLQHSLMNKVHQEYNHPGISQMTRIITTQYYWKGISKSIEKFVRSCHTCQIIKRPKGKPYGALGQIPPPQQPFDLISSDTIAGFSKYGHSKTYLHVRVDHLTRYAWTFPSKSTSTLTYIQTLKNVLQQGSPKRLLSDRAPAFTSEKFRKFLITHGIQPLLTTSNNPQANGLIERLNATITGKLRLAYLENPKASWTQLVKRVTQTYNNTPHSVTSFPPTYLMFNVIPPDLRTHLNPYPEINIAREIASSRTQNKHKKDKETFDKQHRTPHFEVNDLVLVKNYRHPDTDRRVRHETRAFSQAYSTTSSDCTHILAQVPKLTEYIESKMLKTEINYNRFDSSSRNIISNNIKEKLQKYYEKTNTIFKSFFTDSQIPKYVKPNFNNVQFFTGHDRGAFNGVINDKPGRRIRVASCFQTNLGSVCRTMMAGFATIVKKTYCQRAFDIVTLAYHMK
ncbi:K02A2.6-like [Cordylochernes scorpioides]|uniref:RNA-directed DNA polymerase n=1 Tax=Cordylochernes scorpioides TaxID=51811 RepID=A0ABY6L811_9ARAC|nr:K02A2.6-like [Cordylochernes scorpioides]